jgi:predicted Zn-dependent protease
MQKLEDWYTDQDEDGDAMPAIFQYLSTHPQTEERIAVIEAHIE